MKQDEYDDQDEIEPDVDDGCYLCANCERPMPSYHGDGSLCPECELRGEDK